MATEIIYGVHPVLEALRAERRRFIEIMIADNRNLTRLEPILALAVNRRIPIKKQPPAQLEKLAQSSMHQGVIAETSLFADTKPTSLMESISTHPPAFFLLLDGIVDPHNLGALIRTALCAGVTAVIIPKDRAAAPNATVSKASAGALEHIQLSIVTNMVQTIQTLKNAGVWIVGLDTASTKTLYNADLTDPLALVVGGEEKGIRPLVKKNCDHLVSIPQTTQIFSLNASVAGAIAVYEVIRQRKTNGFT